MNALLLSTALLCPAQEPAPSAEAKPVGQTRDEMKRLLEEHKRARTRLPLPPPGDGPLARVNNGRFRQFYIGGDGMGGGTREPDANLTVDPTFKVKLFWITSRANNCYYCLGHQEHKLLAAGLTDDQIAALDGDWADFAPAERDALAFAQRLANAPHTAAADDVARLKRGFGELGALEILVTCAGFNATNRWTDGLNIRAEESGAFFRKADTKANFDTFRTPTGERYRALTSRVAPLGDSPLLAARPAWEPAAEVAARLADLPKREPLFALAGDANAPAWERLLAHFPKMGGSRVRGLKSDAGELLARTRALVAYAAAREDRAWYAVREARAALTKVGLSDKDIDALDERGSTLTDAERPAWRVARILTAAPYKLTDADIEACRKVMADKAVAEVVHRTCNAAFFNRVTEIPRLR